MNNEETTSGKLDLTSVESLLEKQVQLLEEEKAERIEEEKQLEEQEKTSAELLEQEEQVKTEQLQTISTMGEAMTVTSEGIEDSNAQLQLIYDELILMKEQQEETHIANVEGFWIVAVSLAVGIAIKLFWDHVLKW